MEKAMVWAAWLVGAYLAGAIPFGFLIGKMRGVDVRTVGSKNIGVTNVFRTVGKEWGLLAFLCDFLKGFVPVLWDTPGGFYDRGSCMISDPANEEVIKKIADKLKQ